MRRHKFNTNHLGQAFQSSILPKSFALIPGQKFFVRNEQGKYKIQFYDLNSDKKYEFWRRGSSAGSKIINPNYRTIIQEVEGKVIGSLITSILKHVSDKQVAYRFMDAFSYDYNLRRQLQRGASFKLKVEKKYEEKEFIKYGELLYAEVDINGKNVQRRFVEFPDGGAFVDEEWNQENRPFYAPASYSTFSSLFTYRRRHPIQGYVKPHLGLDYELPEGANIYAVSSGKILRMGRNRAAGNYVVIRHLNGLESYYNHLKSLDSSLKAGDFVAQGQVLGKNGCTGYCTKPHLHFAIKKAGKFVDPIKYVKSYPYHRRSYVKRELALNKE
ncbi:MAG: peptidoglycan DD-metalloendopeptidase family protein [Bdellovibrionales bacterium]|nr:peptidoglycan DD-metalloendopeptidase family protein [Bdellovibrionales bacterium]